SLAGASSGRRDRRGSAAPDDGRAGTSTWTGRCRGWGPAPGPIACTGRARSCRFSLGLRLQTLDQRVELFFSHAHAHMLVVHDKHGRIAAGAHALALDQGEQAVGRGFAIVDAQLALEVIAGFLAVAQGTGQVRADRDLVLADRPGV